MIAMGDELVEDEDVSTTVEPVKVRRRDLWVPILQVTGVTSMAVAGFLLAVWTGFFVLGAGLTAFGIAREKAQSAG